MKKTVIKRTIFTIPLLNVPSGRAFSDRKHEENYIPTKPEKMLVVTRYANKPSQLAFYYDLLHKIGPDIKGSIKHTKDIGQSIPVHGCPEQVREIAYRKFLNLSSKGWDRKNWYLELEAA